jgi:hypothetical protein
MAGPLPENLMSTISDDIKSLYPRWMQAVRDKDITALDRTVGSGFRYTDNVQGHRTRDDWMKAALVYEMTSFEFTSMDSTEYGQTTVAFVQYRQEGKLRGVSRNGDWLITDAWHRNETTCQVVARSAILKTTA